MVRCVVGDLGGGFIVDWVCVWGISIGCGHSEFRRILSRGAFTYQALIPPLSASSRKYSPGIESRRGWKMVDYLNI